MENHRANNDALHIDPSNRDGSSFSPFRLGSLAAYEPIVPSPCSSYGAGMSMLSSHNSEIGDSDDFEGGARTVMINVGVADMLLDGALSRRYPAFYEFLSEEQPTWFEPEPVNGVIYRVNTTSPVPVNHRQLRKGINYEMLDLMYRLYREKQVNSQRKAENKELKEANQQLRVAAVQMFTQAEQEEEYISNSLLKKIQQLNQDKEYLVKKYQKDEESLTKSLMDNVAKITDSHANAAAEKLMADKQAEIERLRNYCSRAEKSYQEELMRLRSEKVDHESALEREQELLINTLGKRLSQMNEEKRKLQKSLATAYDNGFAEFDETVEVALLASVRVKHEHPSSHVVAHSPIVRSFEQESTSSVRHQLTESAVLDMENRKLTGLWNKEKRRADAADAKVSRLTRRMDRMEDMMQAIRDDAANSNASLAYRLASVHSEHQMGKSNDHSNGQPSRKRASPPPTVMVPPSNMTLHAAAESNDVVMAAPSPILATVFPTPRSAQPRND
uniref:Coiled-coil domain-containing protein n=1 Tax=Caenorhabditis tropicalis TaxID=1561998 RepID=A0A1I7U0D9_9PELO